MSKIRLNCNHCGKFVWRYPSHLKKSKSKTFYCDHQCKADDQDYGKKVRLICTECGEPFIRFISQADRAKTCSNSCRMVRTQRINGGVGSPGSEKLYPNTLELRKRVAQRIAIRELKDHYIVSCIGGHHDLTKDDIPQELIIAYRKRIKLKRLIK